MKRDEKIETLRRFRELVDRYLFLGFSPKKDQIMPTQGELKMMEALQDPAFQEHRRQISEMKPLVEQILGECGVATIIQYRPAPMTGQPPIHLGLLDLITENQLDMNFEKGMFLDRLDQAIGYLKTQPETDQKVKRSVIETKVDEGFVFIAMPMSPDDPMLEDVHETIKQAALANDLMAERVDDPQSNERITDRIIDSINRAEFVVADITYTRPNVFFEAGYAQGLGKIPIYIARDGTKLEFDLKDYPVIFFKNMKHLREGLSERFAGLKAKRRRE